MTYDYIGGELELFAAASHWKSYLGSILKPHICGRVLEVGAGIGSNIPYLCNSKVSDWTSLEPDGELAAQISDRIQRGELPGSCRVQVGDLGSIEADAQYDAILYIDVLEHILEDSDELAAASRCLRSGGRLIVLAPAHQFLFSPFDAAIGHHRRYTKASLQRVGPGGCRLVASRMLDSIGFFASLANRVLLRSSSPSPRQILFWDTVLVPVSRIVDPCTGYRFGKSVVGVWRRD
ncbi:MAG TPA: methyltransferase domain-containing protein [Aliidongia sp.]|nr:methyltransferase domain-containing protein [Aliidongia sp.]